MVPAHIILYRILPFINDKKSFAKLMLLCRAIYVTFAQESDIMYPFMVEWKGKDSKFSRYRVRKLYVNVDKYPVLEYMPYLQSMYMKSTKGVVINNPIIYLENLTILALENVEYNIYAPKLKKFVFINTTHVGMPYEETIKYRDTTAYRNVTPYLKAPNLEHVTLNQLTDDENTYAVNYSIHQTVAESKATIYTFEIIGGALFDNRPYIRNKKIIKELNCLDLDLFSDNDYHVNVPPCNILRIRNNFAPCLIVYPCTGFISMIDEEKCKIIDKAVGLKMFYYKRSKKVSDEDARSITSMINMLTTIEYLYLEVPNEKMVFPSNLKNLKFAVFNTGNTGITGKMNVPTLACGNKGHFITNTKLDERQFTIYCKSSWLDTCAIDFTAIKNNNTLTLLDNN